MMRVQLKYVERCKVGDRVYYYYRRNGKRWGRIQGKPGSVQFLAEYERIASQRPDRKMPDAGTVDELITAYKSSPKFAALAPNSKRTYVAAMQTISDTMGSVQAEAVTTPLVYEIRDALSHKPGKANSLISVMRMLFGFGVKRGVIRYNPAMEIEKYRLGEHKAWSEELVDAFLKDAEPEVAWLVRFGLLTGQRLSDCMAATWGQQRGEWIVFKQQKTGAEVHLPLYPELRQLLSEIPRRGVTILTTKTGRAWKQNRADKVIRERFKEIEVTGYVFHGLRKSAAVKMREAGLSNDEIKSLTGHQSDAMVAHYTKDADRKVLALSAVRKLSGK